VANYNVDILFNADIRKALKGVDKLQGGVRSVVKEIEKFEQTFKRIAQGSSNRVALAQQRQLAGAINEQNRAIAEQITLASQLGSIYDANARKASEFFRVVRAVADVRQKALPGAGFPGQRALPAAGGTKGEFQRSAQAAAIIDEQNALAAALRRETAARKAAAKASEDLTRETIQIRGLLPPGRSGQSFTRGVDVSGPAVGVGARTGGGSGFQSKVQREVDRQLRVNGQLTKELQETVNSYNKLQTQNDKLVKTTGRLSREINKESQEYASSKPSKRGSGGPGGIGASIGFPLLFGGGAGSIVGGVIGSLTGGFDNAILGSGVGSQVDQFASKLVGLAGALDGTGGSTEALEELLGDLDSETARRIQNLEESGQTALAAEVALQKLSDEIGNDLAKAAVLAGQDLNNLGNQVTKFFTILGVSIASLFQEALYLNTRDPLEGVPEVSPETAAERATSGEAVEVARVQLELAEAKLAKNQESAFAAEQELIDLRKANDLAEITRQIQDDSLDAKIGENKQREIELRARRETADLAERTAAADERSVREAERAAAKAEREARQRERDLQRRENKENQTLKTINSLIISNNEIALRSAQIAHGEEVALEQQAASLFKKFRILKKNVELSTEDARVKDLQLQKLDLQKQLESNQISSRQRSLQVEKAITAEKQKQALAAIGTDVGRQIQDANFRSTGDSAQDAQIALRIDQIRRQEDVTTRLTNAIKEQQITIDNPSTADAAMRAEEQRQNLQDQLDLYNQLLPQLDAAEQSQLRFNQALEAAKPFADAFTSGLLDGMVAVVDGTKTAEQAFADFLRSIADMLFQAAKQMIAQYIAIGIARMFAIPGGTVGDGGMGPLAKTKTNFFGPAMEVFSRGYVGGKALGGSVSGNRPYLVGERGPELFVPGAQGNIVPNSAMGSANVTVNVDASGSSVEGDSEQAGQLGKMLGAAVQAELIKQKRPGGLLAS